MEKRYCSQCDNQCPEDALLCDRGREEFGLEPLKKKTKPSFPPGSPLPLLLQCGHHLHHGLLDTISPAELMTALNPQEQQELEQLLTRLLDDWKKHTPKIKNPAMQQHPHGKHACKK